MGFLLLITTAYTQFFAAEAASASRMNHLFGLPQQFLVTEDGDEIGLRCWTNRLRTRQVLKLMAGEKNALLIFIPAPCISTRLDQLLSSSGRRQSLEFRAIIPSRDVLSRTPLVGCLRMLHNASDMQELPVQTTACMADSKRSRNYRSRSRLGRADDRRQDFGLRLDRCNALLFRKDQANKTN